MLRSQPSMNRRSLSACVAAVSLVFDAARRNQDVRTPKRPEARLSSVRPQLGEIGLRPRPQSSIGLAPVGASVFHRVWRESHVAAKRIAHKLGCGAGTSRRLEQRVHRLPLN